MLSTWHPAPSSLAGVLRGIWSVRADPGRDLSARVLPDGTTCLVFQRGGSVLRTSDDDGRPWTATAVSGPRTGPFDMTLDAGGQIFIVQVEAAGAMPTLGVSMSSLTDRFEALEAIVGCVPRQVSEHLLGAGDDRTCVHALEQWLLGRIRSRSGTCELTDAVVQEVTERGGSVSVEELAGQVSLSRRHLGRIMCERVGVAPKLFTRITRFNHAVQLGRFCPRSPLARVALDAGYADQAHMTREFVALGGIRPSDLRGAGAATIW